MRSSMRVRIVAAVAMVAVALAAAAPAFATTSLTLDGSTTLFPLASKWASVYKAKYRWSITVAGGGSGKGIRDAEGGVVDIGMSSRSKASSDPGDLVFTPVARDVLVHRDQLEVLLDVLQVHLQADADAGPADLPRPDHQLEAAQQPPPEPRDRPHGPHRVVGHLHVLQADVPHERDGHGPRSAARCTSSRRARGTYASNGMVRSAVAGDMYAIGYISCRVHRFGPARAQRSGARHYYDVNYTGARHDSPRPRRATRSSRP